MDARNGYEKQDSRRSLSLNIDFVVQNFRSEPENPYFVEVLLKYYEGRPVIQEITCVSRPGQRVYTGVKNLWRLQRGLGFYILSTSKGILSDRKARENNIGGEILCKVI